MSPRNKKAYNVSDVDPNSFGAVLRRFREEAGLSQEALGDAIGVGQARISTFELNRNVPGQKIIIALAEVLNIAPTVLFEASRFKGALVIDPERREKLSELRERDWRVFDEVLDTLPNVTPEKRASFEQQFREFLDEWK